MSHAQVGELRRRNDEEAERARCALREGAKSEAEAEAAVAAAAAAEAAAVVAAAKIAELNAEIVGGSTREAALQARRHRLTRARIDPELEAQSTLKSVWMGRRS